MAQFKLVIICFFIFIINQAFASPLPDNEVIFKKPKNLTLSIKYINGEFTKGQTHSTFFDIFSDTENEFIPSIRSQRKKSKEVADYFNANTDNRINYHNGSQPKELNFAIKTELDVKNPISNNKLQVISDLYLSQGSSFFGGNDWWIGCKADDCIKLSNKELVILTNNNEAYTIKTGSTNHSFIIEQENKVDKLTFKADPSEIKSIKITIDNDQKSHNILEFHIEEPANNELSIFVDHLELLKDTIAKNFTNLSEKIEKYSFIESEEGKGGSTKPGELYFYLKTKLYINDSPIVNFDETGNAVNDSQIVDVYLGLGKSLILGKNWWIGTSGRYIYRPIGFGSSRMLVKTKDGKVYIIQHELSSKNTNTFTIKPQPKECEYKDVKPAYC